jgi:hypothetical protein
MSETAHAPAIDKSAWGPGPWQDEPDRVDFVHAGLACLALRHPDHGHWCCYVAVPREHPLYGRDHYEISGGLNIHRGVNYTAPCEGQVCHVPAPGMPDDVWWIGADFGHSFDKSPGRDARLREAKAEATAMGAPWAKAFDGALDPKFMREVYRALPYVRRECERLAEQLAALG